MLICRPVAPTSISENTPIELVALLFLNSVLSDLRRCCRNICSRKQLSRHGRIDSIPRARRLKIGGNVPPNVPPKKRKQKGPATPSSQVLHSQQPELVERTRFELATPTLRMKNQAVL